MCSPTTRGEVIQNERLIEEASVGGGVKVVVVVVVMKMVAVMRYFYLLDNLLLTLSLTVHGMEMRFG